jgi:acyl dehydratase
LNHPVLDIQRIGRCQPGDVLDVITLPAVTMTKLAFYCAASGVTDPIHYDREFARRAGFADAVVNGSLRVAWMAQVLNDMLASTDLLQRLACSHRGMMLVGEAPSYEVRYRSHTRAADDACQVEVEVNATVAGQTRDIGEATLRLTDNDASLT